MLVCKFGGSSLSDMSQFVKVKNIVESDDKRQVIVVSALGKRESNDNKLTDLFYVVYSHAKHAISYENLWEEITKRFIDVKNELNLSYDVEMDLQCIRKSLDENHLSVDDLVSRGEYLTARLMSEYLGYDFVDAKDVIIFASSGDIDFIETEKKLKEVVPLGRNVVIPGFYGAYLNGKIKLFGRGGSDISGAIVAACLSAKKYENFTDVSGVLMADPRIIDNPPAIEALTYEELSELTYMGASVLHEASAHPVRDVNIPIHIKNTNDPTALGTLIYHNARSEIKHTVTGISGKKDFLSFTIYKNHMSTEIGFLETTLEIFKRYNINVEHVPTGIDHVGVVVSSASVAHCLEELVEVLKLELHAGEIIIKDSIALITIVGRGIVEDSVFLGRVFTSLGTAALNVSFIAQSPKKLNIIIGVENNDYETATKVLYNELIQKSLGTL